MADISGALSGGIGGAASGASMGTSLLPGWGTAIGAAGGAILGALPALLGDENEEANKKRLAQLKTMMENNTLGLTDQERNAIYERVFSQNQAQIDKMTADRNRQLASGIATGAGQGFNSIALEEDAAARARTEAARLVALEDLKRKREMEAEYYGRVAAAGQRTKERQDTGAGLAIELKDIGYNYMEEELKKGGGPVNQKTFDALASKYGIGQDVLGELMETIKGNPDATKYLSMLGGA